MDILWNYTLFIIPVCSSDRNLYIFACTDFALSYKSFIGHMSISGLCHWASSIEKNLLFRTLHVVFRCFELLTFLDDISGVLFLKKEQKYNLCMIQNVLVPLSQ